jgi:hypothetical protein
MKERMNDGEIIDIDSHLPHRVSEVICVHCGKRWLAVRPITARLKSLECPECTNQGYVIETGEILEHDEG